MEYVSRIVEVRYWQPYRLAPLKCLGLPTPHWPWVSTPRQVKWSGRASPLSLLPPHPSCRPHLCHSLFNTLTFPFRLFSSRRWEGVSYGLVRLNKITRMWQFEWRVQQSRPQMSTISTNRPPWILKTCEIAVPASQPTDLSHGPLNQD